MPNSAQNWSLERPREPGWYNASMDRDADVRRYWDGSRWSVPAYVDDRAEVLNRAMNTPGDPADVIPWRAVRNAAVNVVAALGMFGVSADWTPPVQAAIDEVVVMWETAQCLPIARLA